MVEPLTLDALVAAMNDTHSALYTALSKHVKNGCRVAIEVETAPDGKITAAIKRVLEEQKVLMEGNIHSSDALYARLVETMSQELGKVGLHQPPPKP